MTTISEQRIKLTNEIKYAENKLCRKLENTNPINYIKSSSEEHLAIGHQNTSQFRQLLKILNLASKVLLPKDNRFREGGEFLNFLANNFKV